MKRWWYRGMERVISMIDFRHNEHGALCAGGEEDTVVEALNKEVAFGAEVGGAMMTKEANVRLQGVKGSEEVLELFMFVRGERLEEG